MMIRPPTTLARAAAALPSTAALDARAGLPEGHPVWDVRDRAWLPHRPRHTGPSARPLVRQRSGEFRPVAVTAGPKPE